MAAFVTDNLAAPALPGTRPLALPPPRTAPGQEGLPAAEPLAPPTTRPARPTTKPDLRPAKPAGKPRQLKAFRVATAAAAGLVVFAVAVGSAEVAHNGFRFFVFRAGNTGETAGNETDQQFLAQQAAAHHSTGRHAAPHQTATTHQTGAAKGHHALKQGQKTHHPKTRHK